MKRSVIVLKIFLFNIFHFSSHSLEFHYLFNNKYLYIKTVRTPSYFSIPKFSISISKIVLQKSFQELKALFTIKWIPLCKRQNVHVDLRRISKGLKELSLFTTVSILYSSQRGLYQTENFRIYFTKSTLKFKCMLYLSCDIVVKLLYLHSVQWIIKYLQLTFAKLNKFC